MKHILLNSILIIVIATPLGATAETPAANTVTKLRADLDRFPDREREFGWELYAFGVTHGATAAGMRCAPPAGAAPVVAGEIMAHLRYAAKPTDYLPDAIAKYLIDRGCRPLVAETFDEERLKARAEGLKVDEDAAKKQVEGWLSRGRKELALELLVIRIKEDRAALEEHVRRAEEPGADAPARIIGVVAGARLLELSRGGLRPTQKSVPTTR